MPVSQVTLWIEFAVFSLYIVIIKFVLGHGDGIRFVGLCSLVFTQYHIYAPKSHNFPHQTLQVLSSKRNFKLCSTKLAHLK